eukprot:4033357-Pyramimonas_sp.AAC.2
MLPLPINVGQDGKPKHNTVRSIPIRDRRAGVAGVATEDMTKGKFEYQLRASVTAIVTSSLAHLRDRLADRRGYVQTYEKSAEEVQQIKKGLATSALFRNLEDTLMDQIISALEPTDVPSNTEVHTRTRTPETYTNARTPETYTCARTPETYT